MIRLATLNDAKRIAEISIYGWRTAYKDLLPESYLYGKLSVIKRYELLLKQLETIHSYYVYEDDQIDLIKGFMVISDDRDEPSTDEKSSLPAHELIAIYVEPAFKRQGIGSKMIKHFEHLATEKQKESVCLWVLDENRSSIQFYEKQGYTFEGKTKVFEPFGLKELKYSKKINSL